MKTKPAPDSGVSKTDFDNLVKRVTTLESLVKNYETSLTDLQKKNADFLNTFGSGDVFFNPNDFTGNGKTKETWLSIKK